MSSFPESIVHHTAIRLGILLQIVLTVSAVFAQPKDFLTATMAPVIPPDQGLRYELTGSGSLQAFDPVTKQTRILNLTLPVKVVYPFTPDLRDNVFCFAVDARNSLKIAAATARGIHVSLDGGLTWKDLPTQNSISRNIHFTAVAISPFSENTYLAGTSFDGMYETNNGGTTWKSLTENARFPGKGSGFYEEIRAAAYDPGNRDVLYLGAGFGGGLFRFERKTGKWTEIALPTEETGKSILRLEFTGDLPSGSGKSPAGLVVTTEYSELVYRPHDGSWEPRKEQQKPAGPAVDGSTALSAEQAARRRLAEDRTGIYLSAEQVRSSRLDAHLKFIRDSGMNSLVVDFKDDFGYITYNSSLESVKKAGALNERFKAAELIKKVHTAGLYLIARIVVFKDRQLYRHDGNRYALWDSVTNKAWGDIKTVTDSETGTTRQEQLEFWVDPYCEEVWDYNIAIARELETLGVDEIQFDYIRFPSDGDTSRIRSRFQKEGMTRTDALESFLKKARSALRIPLGTDVYGFNAWFRMKYIGQDIEVFSRYVDVISPMFYPSHFPRDFLGSMQYLPRAEYIYKEGNDRAVSITGGKCVIRPYVQAFLIGGELNFDTPVYTDYLMRQLAGSSVSRGSGFTLWNASGRYYMVTPGITKYTRKSQILE